MRISRFAAFAFGAAVLGPTGAAALEASAALKPPAPVAGFGSGYLWKYAQTVGSAKGGAVTHPGGAQEKHCYADI